MLEYLPGIRAYKLLIRWAAGEAPPAAPPAVRVAEGGRAATVTVVLGGGAAARGIELRAEPGCPFAWSGDDAAVSAAVAADHASVRFACAPAADAPPQPPAAPPAGPPGAAPPFACACGFCEQPVTRATLRSRALPTGMFDDVARCMMCTPKPSLNLSSRDRVHAAPGACLLGIDYALVHEDDVEAGALERDPEAGTLSCARCLTALGVALGDGALKLMRHRLGGGDVTLRVDEALTGNLIASAQQHFTYNFSLRRSGGAPGALDLRVVSWASSVCTGRDREATLRPVMKLCFSESTAPAPAADDGDDDDDATDADASARRVLHVDPDEYAALRKLLLASNAALPPSVAAMPLADGQGSEKIGFLALSASEAERRG